MKLIRTSLYLLLAIWLPRQASADLVGPYTPDANTLFLVHFDEVAGGTVATNVGSKISNFYSVNEVSATTAPATVTTMLGATGYSTNSPTAISFGRCMTNPTAGYVFGYDFNKSGAYDGEQNTANPSADRLALTNLNLGNGGQSPFTLEALVRPNSISANEEIICTDTDGYPVANNTNRGFQFRITGGSVQFQMVGGPNPPGPTAVNGTIPTTGADAFVAGTWYHVAVAYDGAKAQLYWTKVDPSVGAAHLLGTATSMTIGIPIGNIQTPLTIGNDNRDASTEQFLGCIDEVRISNIARAANQMQFYSALVTITQNPVSQNVDYNQPVNFTVGAASLTTLGYQWRFNSNSIAGATNSSYVITNVAASNKGYYDVVVTNTSGNAATSSPALLIVGAANFLNHRYSFNADTSDSIGGAWGTNFGNASVTGGALVLDGTAGTYMQLPSYLFTGANATALTVEFWATFGVNANNVRVFDFGNTNTANNGLTYVGFTPHNASGHQLHISPGDNLFQQQIIASGTLDGLTRHIACVIDPPNKTLAIYTNGVLEAVNTNLTVGIANLNDLYSYIGRSLFTPDPYLNASIDELRIYNGALAGLSIKQSDDQGPNTVLADGPAKFISQPVSTSIPAGQTATFTASAVGYLPITYQWFKNGALVSGATNTAYTFVTTLGDNNASIVCYATNTIGVTTYITNSTTATLSVFIPPTLAWVDAANGGSGDNLWNVTSLNWTNNGGAGPVAFVQTNGAVFDSRGSGSPNVDLVLPITPYSITVNAANDYTFLSSGGNGALNGQGSLTKQNSGKLTIDMTNNLSGPVTISGGTLQVGNGDALGSLGSGPVTNNATLSFDRSDTILNAGNAIHGTGTVSFDGGGAVTISGNNDFSGSTLINAGIVYLTSGTGLGSTSSGTTVASSAQLYITANVDVAEGLSLNGTGPDGNGALHKGGAGATTDNAPIFLAGDSTIGVDSGSTLTLSNVVSGTAALTALGGGTLTLSTNNTFNGGFTLNGPVVNVNANHAFGSGPVTVSGAGRFIIGTGLNLTNAITATTISPNVGNGLLMVADNTNGTVTTVSGPLEFDTSPANGGDFVGPNTSGYLNVTGPITNTATGVVQSRAGRVRFSGGGNYTLFNLNAGIVSLGANSGLCTNASLAFPGSGDASFDLNGFSQALTGLSDLGAFLRLITNSAAAPGTFILNLSGSSTFNGVIAGNLALVENGSGNLLLSATNAYTGNTTVNGGTLELAQASLAALSTVTVASGAVLQLDFAVTNTVAGLVTNGISAAPGVYSATTSSPYLAGAGSLLVTIPVATNPTNITASVSGGNLKLSWPADHIGWRLLVQTNNLANGISTNTNDWGTVSGSANTNQVNVAIDPAKPAEFYRMVYP